ncbi:MAG: amino-acid N-acetyltransferase [Gemmataceae bacterium]|nr:amino-acid N-acetyltransferase [Gemmataceae bacterium]
MIHQLTKLRDILHYVPRFRDRTFVIALDGAVVECENFRNIILDIALLRSLNIDVVLVHGAAHQIHKLAGEMGKKISNADGTGITDFETLQISLLAANRVSHELLEGLSASDLRGAVGNAVIAHPAGILQGIDQQHTGRVERVDTGLLASLIKQGIVPVIPPLGNDGEGHSYRLNSDAVAFEIARSLQAVKLIYLTTHRGLTWQKPQKNSKDNLVRQISVEEAENLLKKQKDGITPEILSKLEQAVKAVRGGVPRVHLIDGQEEEGLLAEVFSNEGIGTLIHANEYVAIRKAQKKDVRAIHSLIRTAVVNDELIGRTRAEIEKQVDDFFVFEVDKNPAGCAAIHLYPQEKKAELACLCVDPRYENQGIGTKLMQYGETQARSAGAHELLCLSTQAFRFFQLKGGFQPGAPEMLPSARKEKFDKSGRNSLVLMKKLV